MLCHVSFQAVLMNSSFALITVLCSSSASLLCSVAAAVRMRWQVATEPETPWTVHQLEPLERDDLFVFQAHRFLDYVSGESNTPLCPFEDGLQTLRCNLAIMHAADTHTWVEV